MVISFRQFVGNWHSDVNKDWTCKDKDKDKDLTQKNQPGQGQGLKFGP